MNSIITVNNLSFSYGKRVILKDVSFSLERGSAAVLVGDNGSGKSTLLALLANIIRGEGEICVFGKIAYLPQDIALIEELTFSDNLKYFASLAHCKVPHTLPFGADRMRKTKIKSMSGGMKKLCSICCMLLCDADIYMFDEPCASLDKEHKAMIGEYIKELLRNGKTVLYVGHDEAEYKDFASVVISVNESTVEVKRV